VAERTRPPRVVDLTAAEATDGDDASQVRSLARGGSLNLGGAVISQVANVGITLLIARLLGRSALGTYAQAYAFLALLVPLSIFGLGMSVTRFVAVHLADSDHGAVRGTIRIGIGVATVSAAVLGAALFLAAPWLVTAAFHDPSLAMPLRTVAVTLPVGAFMSVCLAATQGYRTMKPFALISLVYQPLAQVVGTLALLKLGMGVRGAMVALLASYASGAVLSAVALRRVMRRVWTGKRHTKPVYHPWKLFRFSMVAWVAVLASYGLIWADTILLGLFKASDAVGVYNVATRLVTLASFVQIPITTAFGPRIADLHHRGKTDALRHAYGVTTGWIMRLSLPAFVALVTVPRDLLGVFGSGFRVAAAVTMILAAGKLIDAATGPCAMMLNMAGRPSLNMADNLAVLISNVVLNLLLIPRYGIVGSAVAWALSLGLVNLARVAQVWKGLRMLPFGLGEFKALLAAGITYPVALFAGRAFVPPLRLPLTLAVIVVTYLALSLLLGISQEDRLILDVLLRRGRPLTPAPARAAPAVTGPAAPARAPVVGRDLRPVAAALWDTEAWPLTGGTIADASGGMLGAMASALASSDPELLDTSFTVGVGGLRRARPRPRPPFSPARQAAAVWRRRALLAAGLLAGVALGTVALPRALPVQPGYEASIRLDVRPFTAERIASPGNAGASPEALVRAVRDPAVAEAVLAQLGADAGRLRATTGQPPSRWTARLLGALRVRPVLGSRQQVEVDFADGDRQLAEQVATSYALRFVAKRDQADQARNGKVLAGLQDQADQTAASASRWRQQAAQEQASTGAVSAATQARLDLADDAARVAATQLATTRAQIEQLGAATVAHQPAAVARQSVPVTRAEVLGFGLALGLAIAVSAALLTELAAPRVVSAADAEAATGVDVAAMVPRHRGRRGRDRGTGRLLPPAVERHPGGAEAVAYQQLAATLRRRGLGGDVRVLAVTAADAGGFGGGATPVLVNLAHALANTGHAVLLLSCDLRRPGLEQAYGMDGVPGLAEYLTRAVSEAELVTLLVTVRPNLMLLPAGTAREVPLLASPQLGRAIDELRHLGLTILLETPGGTWSAESLALTDAADAVLLVTRSRSSRWKAVATLAEELRRDYFSVLGVVLTDTRRRSSSRAQPDAAVLPEGGPAFPSEMEGAPPPATPPVAAPPVAGPPVASPSVVVPPIAVPPAAGVNGHANGHGPAAVPSNGHAAKPASTTQAEREPPARQPAVDPPAVLPEPTNAEGPPVGERQRKLGATPGPRRRHERWR